MGGEERRRGEERKERGGKEEMKDRGIGGETRHVNMLSCNTSGGLEVTKDLHGVGEVEKEDDFIVRYLVYFKFRIESQHTCLAVDMGNMVVRYGSKGVHVRTLAVGVALCGKYYRWTMYM